MTFTWKNPGKRAERERVWFERWIREGYTVRQLVHQSGHGTWKMQSIIRYWLDRPPTEPTTLASAQRIIVDGSYLDHRHGIVAIMNGESRCIIAGRFGIKEGSALFQRFCESLKQKGLAPESATIDGNPQLFRCLRMVWPNITVQRCLVHIQRQGLSWCRRDPKRADAKHLRELLLRVTSIETGGDRDTFLSDLQAWEERYGSRLARRPGKGWVMSDLIRARSMIRHALPNMFHYLDDPTIAKTTNGLEGYFSRLKGHYRRHRGLSKEHRDAYFRWHFALHER